jgi:type IV secretion system protein VirD4
VTVRARTVSKPLFDLFDKRGRRSGSVSISEQKRPLLLPQEIKELGRDREILICEGLRPILARKNRYFQDRRLRARLVPQIALRPRSERFQQHPCRRTQRAA